jgi:hypothetical protein
MPHRRIGLKGKRGCIRITDEDYRGLHRRREKQGDGVGAWTPLFVFPAGARCCFCSGGCIQVPAAW